MIGNQQSKFCEAPCCPQKGERNDVGDRIEEEAGDEEDVGNRDERGEEEVIGEAQEGKLVEVDEDKRKRDEVDGEVEGERFAAKKGEGMAHAIKEGELPDFRKGAGREPLFEEVADGRIDEKNGGGAEEAKLKTELEKDAGVEKELPDERGTKSIEGGDLEVVHPSNCKEDNT